MILVLKYQFYRFTLKRGAYLEKKIVYFLLHSIFFVLYVLIFNRLFNYINMKIPSEIDIGLLLFMFQIGFTIVILFPASIVTTKKIIEIIQSP